MKKLTTSVLAGLILLACGAPVWGQSRISELQLQLQAAEAQGNTTEAERLRAELERLQTAPTFDLDQITVTGTRTPRSVGGIFRNSDGD